MLSNIPDAPVRASPIEKADVAVVKAVAPLGQAGFMRALGWLSEAGDQPQMRILCAGVIAVGLYKGDAKLAGAGVKMLIAHSAATGMKALVKHRVNRTRPTLLVEEGRYGMAAGDSREHDKSSFPSGHTAGAVAVAAAFAHEYPGAAGAAYAAAGGIAVMQIPRCAHYPSDVGVGALIGLAAATGTRAVADLVGGLDDEEGGPRAHVAGRLGGSATASTGA